MSTLRCQQILERRNRLDGRKVCRTNVTEMDTLPIVKIVGRPKVYNRVIHKILDTIVWKLDIGSWIRLEEKSLGRN